jgi:hypothetical protein
VNYWYGLTGDDWNHCPATDLNACLAPYPPFTLPTPHTLQMPAAGHPYTFASQAMSPLFVSNCHSDRGNYLQELMKYVPIHSYGGCFGTPGLQRAEQGRIPKQKVCDSALHECE